MAAPFFRLFTTFLCFSYTINCFINAVPVTRSRSLVLLDISQEHNVLSENIIRMEKTRREVLEAEEMINDYPGSGANNRHTPRSQLGRGCVEC
ncbi:hypothetical protein MTR67_015179 [Solanum verrucosum]|uniref:Uncharacterized protein n=1 Tax=Solanum verrucosum TaxID=315347 RepID=A0AAF0QDJ2_SOLVR|nr:hypothetical protein MTR67_015179 [Solanum verrucosum]